MRDTGGSRGAVRCSTVQCGVVRYGKETYCVALGAVRCGACAATKRAWLGPVEQARRPPSESQHRSAGVHGLPPDPKDRISVV